MPKVRESIHPFFADIMQKHGCSTIKDLSAATGIPYTTLISYASVEGQKAYKKIVQDAQQLGVDPGIWILQLSQDLTENNAVK